MKDTKKASELIIPMLFCILLFVLCDIGTCLHKLVEVYLAVPFHRLLYFPNLLEVIVLAIFLQEIRHAFLRNHQHAILWQYLVKLLDLITQIEVEAKEMQHLYRYIRIELIGIKLLFDNRRQNALWAGMEAAVDHCDAMVSIDADLQDDENVIIDMVQQVQEGKDIIYGVRKERKTDTFFKRFTAQAFYKLMQSVDKDTVYNHADFRMMTNRTLKALMQYSERNLFLRAIVRQLGFREGFVYYDRKAREAGESKYPLTKMLSFSIDGITSFSVAPLKFITFLGLAMTLVAFIMIIFALVEHFQGKTIQGWTSLLVSMWFIGGIITTGVGITGVYIGKIYTEVKRRPRYFIEERV